ncbi:MAG TPA: glycosyl transferase family 90 [Cyclobacteriaceae bacterium]|nr:glycosyl transferase family 90 [Cyclobacteriaceae bacterium]
MKALNRKFEWKHRNNKFLYYTKASFRELLPASYFRSRLKRELSKVKDFDIAYIRDRVNYYNRISETRELSHDSITLGELKVPKKDSVYYFDTYEYSRYFDPTFRAKIVYGDVLSIPQEPTILKYRPIPAVNENYVLLKLNKVRLFSFSNDKREFQEKKDMLIGRAVVKYPARVRFYEKYFNHRMCDLGLINKDGNPLWRKEKITIDDHLDYKFILCLEGYDIASNLRWVMSSNSLAVMPKPTYESWYMEERLIPNYHYVLIKDDYSDLEERLNYYIENADEALRIIENAKAYANQFRNKKREDLISLLVLEKYFYRTCQLEPISDRTIFDA